MHGVTGIAYQTNLGWTPRAWSDLWDARLTGKLTIAEFAENAEIIQMLTSLGVDFAQGYGIAQPQRVMKTAGNA